MSAPRLSQHANMLAVSEGETDRVVRGDLMPLVQLGGGGIRGQGASLCVLD